MDIVYEIRRADTNEKIDDSRELQYCIEIMDDLKQTIPWVDYKLVVVLFRDGEVLESELNFK